MSKCECENDAKVRMMRTISREIIEVCPACASRILRSSSSGWSVLTVSPDYLADLAGQLVDPHDGPMVIQAMLKGYVA